MDAVIIDLFLMGVSNALLMWKTAPSRNPILANRQSFQTIFGGLPNNIFDRSTRQTRYNLSTRSLSLILKTLQLSLFGGMIGIATCLLCNTALAFRMVYDNEPTFIPCIPSLKANSMNFIYF